MSNPEWYEDTQKHLVGVFDAGQDYWNSAYGQAQWHCERACLGPILERLTGQHALELGMASPLIELAPVRHHIRWTPSLGQAMHPSTLVCDPAAMALPDESMDVVLVHHLLEAAPKPHHILREAARVTSDHGSLLIVGWHPFGLGMLNRCLPSRRNEWPCHGQWHSVQRMKDWLTFVDFEIERVDYCGFGVSGYGNFESWGRRHNFPLGSAFVINACRKMTRVRPIRLRFPVRAFVPGGMVGHGTSLAHQNEWHEKGRIKADE
ncbi:class I SAM-dependent methyltransferase [Phytohalomonas tamaricis]|uniref:class I SAM-dependent methyltransferase n=1 Tax=Phytohalomonas tamaricis TaxID=2081032 RepID=UPI000D0B2C02|nr:methyltransferase domain-containing protein [Phytohalomonas tamaricis]